MPGQAPPLTDERALLLAYLAQQRDGIRYAAYGLTDEQARQAPTAGSLSVGGLVKHATHMERTWVDLIVQREGGGTFQEQQAEYEENFRLGPDETLAEVLARYDEVAKETDAVVSDLDHTPCPCPAACRGTPTTSRRGRCGGSCSTSSRRPPATRATPTSSASRSTVPRCTRSWPPPKGGPPPSGSSRGRRRRDTTAHR